MKYIKTLFGMAFASAAWVFWKGTPVQNWLKSIAVATAAAAIGFLHPAQASVTVNATGEGWCSTTSCNNTNVLLISNTYASEQDGYRDWFAFNIPDAGSISSATLQIWNDAGNTVYFANSNIYNSYQASSIGHDGLIGGALLGSIDVNAADTGVSQYVSISLDSTAVSLLTAAEGSTFIFGGATTAGGGQIFGYTNGTPVAMLTLDAAAVPEPATLALLGGSICGISFLRRRRA